MATPMPKEGGLPEWLKGPSSKNGGPSGPGDDDRDTRSILDKIMDELSGKNKAEQERLERLEKLTGKK